MAWGLGAVLDGESPCFRDVGIGVSGFNGECGVLRITRTRSYVECLGLG